VGTLTVNGRTYRLSKNYADRIKKQFGEGDFSVREVKLCVGIE